MPPAYTVPVRRIAKSLGAAGLAIFPKKIERCISCRGDQAGVLRQPYCYVCAAVFVELPQTAVFTVRITRKNRHITLAKSRRRKRSPARLSRCRIWSQASDWLVRTRSTTRLSTFSSASTPFTPSSIKTGGAIRRVNVNIAATTAENYRKLKDAGIGTTFCFRRPAIAELPQAASGGPKHDYDYHTEAMGSCDGRRY